MVVVRRAVLVLAGVVAAALGWVASGDDTPAGTPSPAETSTTAASDGTSTTEAGPAVPEAPWPPLEEIDGLGALRTASGVVVPIVAVRPTGGYDVRTPCNRPLLVADGEVLADAHVVLDPGHGGDQSGTVGANGLLEADLNLAVARRTADVLRAAGVTVVLTRDHDLTMSIGSRARIAEALQPLVFLSIHHNAVADGPAAGPGTEAYFQVASADSRRLAGLVVEELRAALGAFEVAWESDESNGARARVQTTDRGTDFYGVLRRTAEAGITGVLSEAGFLSNPAEAAMFAGEEAQQAEAEALARALTRFVAGEEPGGAAFSPEPPSVGVPGSSSTPDQSCVDPPLG